MFKIARFMTRLAVPLTMLFLLGWYLPEANNISALELTTGRSLGTAESFAVLAGSTVTNTGPTVVSGNLGVSPGNAITGFPPGLVRDGVMHAADAVALQTQNDIITAYDALAGQRCDVSLTGHDLGGLTLTPGTYCFSSSAQLTGTLTLNAEGNPDAVFIFQIASKLTTASSSSVIVINGGSDCNVFWKIGSSATLGTNTTFVGSILALTSISLTTGATVSGRALARNGAVTMDRNRVSIATCSPNPTPTPTPTPPSCPDQSPSQCQDGTPTSGQNTTPSAKP